MSGNFPVIREASEDREDTWAGFPEIGEFLLLSLLYLPSWGIYYVLRHSVKCIT